ncbi:hypothetical protein QOZ92_001001 [Paeniclostridium ghonii]|uniref:Uncharacterized protein n=1 Tax=Paraclostridium ghonii TaxID=29358 RepID=A0ABU0MY94_9FIRM|nr:hypothetical protein [Paeniclostridium ghonii]
MNKDIIKKICPQLMFFVISVMTFIFVFIKNYL